MKGVNEREKEKEKEKLKKLSETFKNLVDCYYLLLKKFKKKSSYVLDEFLIKEKKEPHGILSIYEDVNIDSFHFFILSLLDSEYDNLKQVNILNIENGNLILKALCFYMDNITIKELLKKNVKGGKIGTTNNAPNEEDKKGTKPLNKQIATLKKEKGKEKEAKEAKEEKEINKDTNIYELGFVKKKKNLCNIKTLSIFNSNINASGILFLAKSLYNNEYPKMEHLSVDCNVLSSECIRLLSLSLCNYNNLKSLSFQYTNLKDDSIKYIIDIIVYINSSLSVLKLCGNQFTEEGMTKLFESFLLNTSLTTIDVSYNMFNLSSAFVEILGKVIANTMNITTILATGNFIEIENLKKINEHMDLNKSIASLKLPQGVDDELLDQIKKKLIGSKKKKNKKKTN